MGFEVVIFFVVGFEQVLALLLEYGVCVHKWKWEIMDKSVSSGADIGDSVSAQFKNV